MQNRLILLSVLMVALTGCGTTPKVSQSQSALWQKFGHKPLNNLLLAWGPPLSETRREDGMRVLSYSYANTYDLGKPTQKNYKCTISYIVTPTNPTINDIVLQGQDYECAVLANGYTGQNGINPAHPNTFLRDNPPAKLY